MNTVCSTKKYYQPCIMFNFSCHLSVNQLDYLPCINYRAHAMKLFLVHAGYYDSEIGIYELHTNFLIAATDVCKVKAAMEDKMIFKKKNMHIDAVQEIEAIDGYDITLIRNENNITKVTNYDYTQIKQLTT